MRKIFVCTVLVVSVLFVTGCSMVKRTEEAATRGVERGVEKGSEQAVTDVFGFAKDKTKESLKKYLRVTGTKVNVREASTAKSNIVCKVQKGDKVEKIDEFENWYKVKLEDGKKGWLHKDLAKPAVASGFGF